MGGEMRRVVRCITIVGMLCVSTLSQSQEGKPKVPEPRPCGDQGKDNRPNICARLVDGTWFERKSTCTRVGSKLIYTHCNGVDKMEFDAATHLCTQGRQCPGAYSASLRVDR